ncbi:MAG: fumarate hydratase [Eggerthellaceae bacterium]|nr:fumarate hydratase [Eggerthellaceae bacterium]
MKFLDSNNVAEAIAFAIPQLAAKLPADVRQAMAHARDEERGERARIVLDQLCDNCMIAGQNMLPICQDTGTVWVCLEIGPDVNIHGDIFSEVNDVVAHAYTQNALRKSVVRDALFDRTNTQDNTPAFCELRFVDEPGAAHLHVMLKGGGSDNASCVTMLTPSAGKQGVIDTVIARVKEKASCACPPLVVGVGVGATFDKVAGLSKLALMRPLGTSNPDPEADAFEQELLAAINETGIGAGALGGKTTALAVRVKTAPCHIAALPVAVNMGCSALRRMTIEL